MARAVRDCPGVPGASGTVVHSTWRYKILHRTVFVEAGHFERPSPYAHLRRALDEMLVLASWLYESFPDVELVANLAETPIPCDVDVPWLQVSTLKGYNPHETGPRHAPPGTVPGLTPGGSFSRGVSIPTAWSDLALAPNQLEAYAACVDDWSRKAGGRIVDVFWRGAPIGSVERGLPFSTSPPSVQPGLAGSCSGGDTPHAQEQGALQKHGMWQNLWRILFGVNQDDKNGQSSVQGATQCPRAQRLLTQDGSTGSSASPTAGPAAAVAWEVLPGMAAGLVPRLPAQLTPLLRRNLRVPRLQLALRAMGRTGLDVCVVNVSREWPLGPHADSALSFVHAPEKDLAALAALAFQPPVPLQRWARHAFTVSIDDWGPPAQLPAQLLLGSVVLKVASPLQAWYEARLQPGVHYVPVAGNLTTFEEVAGRLLSLAVANDSDMYVWRQRTAHAAALAAVDNFNLLAQLDDLMWGVMLVKAHTPWPVGPPKPRAWHALNVDPDSGWAAADALPLHIREEINEWVGHNFYEHCVTCDASDMTVVAT